MKLRPSLRQKKRYLAFELISSRAFPFADVEKEVFASLHHFLGDLGMAKAAPMLVKEKYKNQKFIIKVNHTAVDECKAGIMLLRKVKEFPVIPKSIITSGTLKKASSYL